MKSSTKILAAGLLSATAFTAQAGTLDFTSNAVLGSLTGTDYSKTGSVAGVGYTISSFGKIKFGDNLPNPTTCSGLACEVDGIGVNNEEIDFAETFTIEFDKTVKIFDFDFLDLFDGEVATVTANGNTYTFAGTEALPGTGFLTGVLGTTITTDKVTFTATNLPGDQGDNNYAVAGIDLISAVPVPAAAFLFAPALIGFMGLRRNAAKKA